MNPTDPRPVRLGLNRQPVTPAPERDRAAPAPRAWPAPAAPAAPAAAPPAAGAFGTHRASQPPPAAPQPAHVARPAFSAPAPVAQSARPPRVVVGVNALEVASGSAEIITFGLGSCIAVVLYDAQARVGGMCHFMLADSSLDLRRAQSDPLTFGDLSIPRLLSAFAARGGNPHSAEAFMIGGASIASLSDIFDIGKRNAVMARAMLERHGLRVRGEETGGRSSRTVSLDVQGGTVIIQTPGLTSRRLR